MAKLLVYLDGGVTSECTLHQDKEFILGRGTQCDIVLPHPKVSRQHAKIFFDGQNWVCKVISKFGHIVVNGHVTGEVTLINGASIGIPPFEIKYVEDAEQSLSQNSVSQESLSEDEDGDEKTEDLSDRTNVVALHIKAVLRKLGPDNSVVDEVVIGNEGLTAGRSSSCELRIEDTHASRRHFSIEYDGENYVLKDLGSANKTYVNDKEILEHVLQSGDEIIVGKERHRFEIINTDFENLPAVVPDTAGAAAGFGEPRPAVIKYVPERALGQFNSPRLFLSSTAQKLNSSKGAKVKIAAIIGILGFILYGALTGNKNVEPPRNVAGQPIGHPGGPSSYDRLPPDQKKFVDETYNLALNLYTTGKYDLAAVEINKVIAIVGNFKDAKNMEALCQQAIEIQKQKDEGDRQAREQEALKQKVSDILDSCDKFLKDKQYTKVMDCTSQVSELDPESERATNLNIAAKLALDEIENSKEHQAELSRRLTNAKNTYSRAKKAITEKRYPAALSELNRVEKSDFPDKEGLKEKAKQDIAIVKARMLHDSQTLAQEGKTALDSKEYADAIKKFNQALVLAPFNAEAKSMRETASRELHLEMKNMYSESVIEENLGNIESAKKKWATIIKEDERTDTYYEKAQIKLKRYEK